MDITFNNAWVDSYLDALLSKGLSAEHIAGGTSTADKSSRLSALDEEQSITARYYVNQILSLDEGSIRDAWTKASRPSRLSAPQAERDARMEQLSWRVWGMKRRRAQVAAAHDAERLHHLLTVDEDDEAQYTTHMTLDDLNSTVYGLDQTMDAVPEEQDHEAPSKGTPPSSATAAARKASSAAAQANNLASPFASQPSPTGPGLSTAFAAPLGIPRIATSASGLASGTISAPASPTAGGLFNAGSLQPPTASAVAAASGPDPLLVSRFPRLYIILISLHGLVRGEKMELGKDPDTGGQVKYVVELAKTLGQFPSVARVDLLTRLIADPKVDKSYSEPEERLILPPLPPAVAALAAAANGGLGGDVAESVADGSQPSMPATPAAGQPANSGTQGAFIVRLPCGPPNTYLRKEDLWPHVREFSDRAIMHAQATLSRLQETGPCELYVVHGHYADAGEVAAQVASSLGVDCVLTGHSLGRNKKEHLLKSGTMSNAEVEAAYKINRRIEAEERALDTASVVFTSTKQEVAEQWGTYDGYSDELSAALQLRPCRGYHVPRMAVIPPGLDFSNLKVSIPSDPWEEVLGTGPLLGGQHLSSAGDSGAVTAKLSTLSPHGSDAHTSLPPNGPDAPAGQDVAAPLPPAGASPVRAAGGVLHEGLTVNTSAAVPMWPSVSVLADGNRLPPKASIPASASDMRLSRRTSHTGQQMALSVAATPRSSLAPQVTNPAFINPGKLAVMMVGDSEPPIWREINRFLRHPGRPVILAMSRPDAKKNILGLVHAYGKSRVLRELANLVLVLGNRDVIDGMATGSSRVLTDVLKLVDSYDLYGQVAYPKKHSQADISDIYLLAAATRGVFVNVALQEPFGLTLIEAAAHGAPIVATTNGGPVDIVATLKNGSLVEPTNVKEIADACISIITNQRLWDECSESGRRNITAYAWPSHCARYLRTVADQKATQNTASRNRAGLMYGVPAGDAGQAKGGSGPGPRIRHTFSLSFDDLNAVARAVGNVAPASLAPEGLGSSRASEPSEGGKDAAATPTDKSAAALLVNDSAQATAAAAAAAAANAPEPPAATIAGDSSTTVRGSAVSVVPDTDTDPFADFDMSFPTRSAASASAGGSGFVASAELLPRITLHQNFVLFNIDSVEDVHFAAPLLRALLGTAKKAAPAADASPALGSRTPLPAAVVSAAAAHLTAGGTKPVGVGIACTWNNKQLRALLEREGVDPLALDFTVCNAGAMIWLTMGLDGAAQQLPANSFLCDDDWETHIDWRWDERVVPQVLRRILDSKVGWGKLALVHTTTLRTASNAVAAASGASATAAAAAGAAAEAAAAHEALPPAAVTAAGGPPNMARMSSNAVGSSSTGVAGGAGAGGATTRVVVSLSPQCTPLHMMVDVEVTGPTGSKPALTVTEVAIQLLSSVRRKLRLSGVRAQVTITPREELPAAPTGGAAEVKRRNRGRASAFSAITGTLQSLATSLAAGFGGAIPGVAPGVPPEATGSLTIHITPLRCSRAMALRHLSMRYRAPLPQWTVVSVAAGATDPAGLRVSATDGEEVVGGLQRVLLLGTSAQVGALSFPLDASVFKPAVVEAAALPAERPEGDAAPRVTLATL